MNIPTHEYDPWFVEQTMREKQEYAAGERVARRAQRTHRSGKPALYHVRRRLGLQFIALGAALAGPALETVNRYHDRLDTWIL